MKCSNWRAVAVAAALLSLAPASAWAAKHARVSPNDEFYKELETFENALALVQSDYVEEPEAKDLIYGALKGMLATLDPYSQFLDPDSYNELKVETEGEFGGLGIEITIKDELLTVITPLDETPAAKAGIKPQDRIVKIDGELTRGLTLLDAVKKLRGKPGSTVRLTILREGENELLEVEVPRAIIKIRSVRNAEVLEEKIGYVRIADFGERTTEDLRTALDQLKQQEMESLIIDLRNNPGGLLDVAVSTSELFLKRNDLIVSTKGRLRNQNMEFRARGDGSVNGVPLVVLINEGSASASEIFAGAIQDHHRGVILGTKSHGKASVQTVFPLKDGSALKLTTSKYFTPSGKSIHGEGIHPDVEVKLEELNAKEEEKGAKPNGPRADEVFDRLEQDEKKDGAAGAKPEDAVQAPKVDTLRDNQLARAVDLLKGLRVYQHQGVIQ